MIKIQVNESNEGIKEIKIKGHAMYDDYGKDIVCAAVSSIVVTTINAVESINKEAISYDENPLVIRVLKNDEIVCKLLKNMISLLGELEHDFPDNIRFL